MWCWCVPSRISATGRQQATPSAFKSVRSEEHTSELQSLMRISYAVFCLKKKKTNIQRDSDAVNGISSRENIDDLKSTQENNSYSNIEQKIIDGRHSILAQIDKHDEITDNVS